MASNPLFTSPLASAGIQAGGSVLGSLIGGAFGTYQQNKADENNRRYLDLQYQYNSALSREEYARNLSQWQIEQEYNKPINQMERLREAGINPHLAYAKGSFDNTSPRSPQYQAPTYGLGQASIPDISGYMRAGQSVFDGIVNTMLNASNLESQKDLAKARTLNVLAQIPGTRAKSTIQSAAARFADRVAEMNVEQKGLNLLNTSLQSELIRARTGLTQREMNRVDEIVSGLKLDNKFKGDTLLDRKLRVTLSVSQAIKDIEKTVVEIQNGRSDLSLKEKDLLIKDVILNKSKEEVVKLENDRLVYGNQSNWLVRMLKGAVADGLSLFYGDGSPFWESYDDRHE